MSKEIIACQTAIINYQFSILLKQWIGCWYWQKPQKHLIISEIIQLIYMKGQAENSITPTNIDELNTDDLLILNNHSFKRSGDLLRAHSPSVQFLLSIMLPLQCFPPFLGGGAWHSRLRQWVHSVPQADHFAHSVQPPSTGMQNQMHAILQLSKSLQVDMKWDVTLQCSLIHV